MQLQSLFQESTQAKIWSNGLAREGHAMLYERCSLQRQHRTSLLVQPGEHTQQQCMDASYALSTSTFPCVDLYKRFGPFHRCRSLCLLSRMILPRVCHLILQDLDETVESIRHESPAARSDP